MKNIIALMVMALVLAGCNNSTEYVEVPVGEVQVVEKEVILECDMPLLVSAILTDDNITVQYDEDNETFSNEFGVDFSLIALYPCPIPPITEVEPEDGICPAGWEFATECSTVCTEIEEIAVTCGEGTIMDENNTCVCDTSPDIGICGEGTELDDNGTCVIIDNEVLDVS